MTLQLKQFPSELLSEIMAFVNGLYIVRLYLSGDTYFIQHLLRSIRDFRLVYHNYLNISWPHIISRFTRLNRLEIKVPAVAMYIHIPHVDLTTIPPSVEYLSLDFSSSFHELLRHAPADCGQPERPLLSEILPNLRHITWKSMWKKPETMTHSVARTLISSLPRSIQQITSPYNSLKFADIADLPRSLTHMSIYLTEFRLEKPHFPETLSYLRIYRSFAIEEVETSIWDYLPETLTTLEISGAAMPLNKVNRLPKELVRLRVAWRELAPEAVMLLPQSLLDLGISIIEAPTDIEAHKHFPKNLTSLSVLLHSRPKFSESKQSINLEMLFKYLPTTLKHFYHYTLPCAPEFWKYLPRGMVSHFSADNDSLQDPSLLTTLPQNITSMCIHMKDPAMVQLFPRKLVDLRLVLDDLDYSFLNASFFTHLTDLECLELGEGVDIALNDAPNEFPKLRDLILETPVAWCSIDWSRPWASRLRYLSMTVKLEQGNTTVDFSTQNPFPGDDWFATLPPSLIQFSYTASGLRARLPSSLLKYFPHTLQRLLIEGFRFNGPIDLHFRSLPAQLSSFSLYNASADSKEFLTVSEETLRLFPPSLGSFTAYLSPTNPNVFNQLVELRPYIKYHIDLPAQQEYRALHLGPADAQ